jgi:hypothetical protein
MSRRRDPRARTEKHLNRTAQTLKQLALRQRLSDQRHGIKRYRVVGQVELTVSATSAAEAKRIAQETYGMKVRKPPQLMREEDTL